MLALLALLSTKVRSLFWTFAIAFNVVGTADILIDYFQAIRLGLPLIPGQLGATYVIPIISEIPGPGAPDPAGAHAWRNALGPCAECDEDLAAHPVRPRAVREVPHRLSA